MLSVSAGVIFCALRLAIGHGNSSETRVERYKWPTFGMAYTKDPRGAEDVDSEVAVVRKRTRFGPLFVSCRCMFVAGALGRGNETSMGAFDPLLCVIGGADMVRRAL